MNVSGPVARLGRSGFRVLRHRRELAALRGRFRREHWIALPGLLEAPLLEALRRRLRRARFQAKRTSYDRCLGLRDGSLAAALCFHLNDPAMLKLVGYLTGDRVRGCSGKIRRHVPGARHRLKWHSDAEDGIVSAAISIDLSRARVRGGGLQLRTRAGARTPRQAAQVSRPGDALLFRVRPSLLHRHARVSGRVPRDSFAGGFLTVPLRLPGRVVGGDPRAPAVSLSAWRGGRGSAAAPFPGGR